MAGSAGNRKDWIQNGVLEQAAVFGYSFNGSNKQYP